MKNQWRLYLGLFFTFIIVIFAILNNQIVSINYGFGHFEAPLVLVIFSATLIGALIVSLMTTGVIWRQKKERKKLQKEITDYKQNFEKKVEERVEALILENNQLKESQPSMSLTEFESSPEEISVLE